MTNGTARASQLAYAPLAALGAALQGRGVRSELGFVLDVATPAVARVVFCRPRVIDGDRLWFFDGGGEPIAPAEQVTEAAMIIADGDTP
ncbi:hypothetical protein [Actinomadura terrae]|uniref:hypothetical protein n=1 Tax=Actinomadura terrae TaxID=604353 RepID=UPI001FA6BEEA|nr:hypothetical protein [Actinomadura terrae]